MKKILIICICCISAATQAQLKIDSLGMILMHDATNMTENDTPNALVTIGDNPNFYWSDFSNITMGIECCKIPGITNESIGIYSEIFPIGARTQPACSAIWGVAAGSSIINYGVVGGVNGNNGAGIYGTAAYGPSYPATGSYAGYFDGAVYVNGNMTVTAQYNLSDMRLKENVSLLSESDESSGNVIDNLQKLNVIEYNLRSAATRDDTCYMFKHCDKETEQDSLELKRRHYGLSAQELQKVYPDLVLEGQDGYLAVNYTELVPILIRSIQELKQQVDELQGKASSRQTRSASWDEDTPDSSQPSALQGCALYQNRPNPFSESTTIRFTLPEDAHNAFIYIFDMNGRMQKQIPVDASMQSVTISGGEFPAGIYLYSLVVGGQEIDTKRMILSK